MESDSQSVPATDRAFLYGDGVFETLLLVNGVALWRDLHLDRLMLGAHRLKIAANLEEIRQTIIDVSQRYPSSAGVLRLTVSRCAKERGYTPALDAEASITATHSPLNRDPFEAYAPAAIETSSIVMGDQPLLAGLKHCNRLEQVLAAAEAQERAVDDVLLCNAGGTYLCSSNANLFALKGDELLTSPCERSGVRGTRRRLFLEGLAESAGLSAREVPLSKQDLSQADGLFLCNSIMGVRSVKHWDGKEFAANDTLHQVQATYYDKARQCCGM